MQFQCFNKILLEEQVIHSYDVSGIRMGYEFKIRYPSYRGTYLSCIESLTFTMDGEEIPLSTIRFCLNGKQYLIRELKDMYKVYWHVLDYAQILVLDGKDMEQDIHQIGVTMVHRIPYAGYGGKYLALPSVSVKQLKWEGKS